MSLLHGAGSERSGFERAELKRAERLPAVLDVQLSGVDDDRPLGRPTRTIDVSDRGLLVEVPDGVIAGCGARVRVRLRWDRWDCGMLAEVVRVESPFWRGRPTAVMGLHLATALPPALLDSLRTA